MDPAARMLRYFAYTHLPPHLAESLPAGPEKTAGMRKLLEAKDCAVRAALDEADR